MAARRVFTSIVLVTGLAMTALGQLQSGGHPAPLFDGLVVEDPYRFVEPPPGGAGDPFAASEAETVRDGSVPLLAIATDELPPQAQLIAQADAFEIGPGTTSIVVSIQPLAPGDRQVAGNVYRFAANDQTGAALPIVPGALVTIVLRGSQPDPGATVGRRDGAQWLTLPTQHGGLPDLYAANIDRLGDFAVLTSAGPGGTGASPSAAGTSPAPSMGPGDGAGGAGTATWAVVALAVAALVIGLGWGRLAGADDD